MAMGMVIKALIINIHLQNNVRNRVSCSGVSSPPASEPSHAIKIGGRSTLNQARGESSQHLADVENPTSATKLIASVPSTQDEMHSWEEGGLKLQ